MRTVETVAGLATFARRGAGSDAERRAAQWLARELEQGDVEPAIEPFWCRPNWALAHSWHALLAIVGSLWSVYSPVPGAALILLALLSVITDALLGVSLGRRLTPERASQNVVVPAPSEPGRITVVLTANYDAGRTGLVFGDRPRATAARLKRVMRGVTPGWLGWFALALIWLQGVAVVRLAGSRGTAIGAVQLIPTVALVLGLALLLDAAVAEFGPAAGDNGSGVAAALALARALDSAPPRHASIELVLAGAGDCGDVGLRRHLRAHAQAIDRRNTIVVGIAPCAGGSPQWWTSDGPLVPLRCTAQLRTICKTLARQDPERGAQPHRGRGCAPGLAARISRIPTFSIGCLDDRGLAPRSHRREDTPETVDRQALERGVQFALRLIDAIDAQLGSRRAVRA
jgi:hypothetical protein